MSADTETRAAAHTPEPWGFEMDGSGHLWVGPMRPDAKISEIVFGVETVATKDEQRERRIANAARACHCVNALRGLNPEAVPKLVEAVELVVEELGPHSNWHGHVRAIVLACETALAELRNETQGE